MNLRTLLMIIMTLVIGTLFLVFAYGFTHSGVDMAQQGILDGAQQLIGTSPGAVGVSVNNGVPAVSALPPTITGVTWDAETWGPGLTIRGTNFGSSPSLTELADTTTGWGLGGVLPSIVTANNLEIRASGFSGGAVSYGSGDPAHWGDGQGSFSFRPGDSVQLQVTNSQTGQTASFTTTYPKNAPMPTITMNPTPLPATTTDGTINLSGQVAFNGTPLANQAVCLSASSGTFSSSSGQTVTDHPGVFMTFTDASGNWSAAYTAPGTAGKETITASTAGQSISASTQAMPPSITGVAWNTSTWSPQATLVGSGFGNAAGNVELYDANGSPSWWDNTGTAISPSGAGSVKLTAQWSNQAIIVSDLATYHQIQGWRNWLSPGDAITMDVENVSGQTLTFDTAYPKSAPMPIVSLRSIASVQIGQSTTVGGSVSFDGQPLANQQVQLSVNGGSLSSATVTTNANGDFSGNYSAPNAAETDTITATVAGQSVTQALTVIAPPKITGVTWNTSTWAPSLVVSGSGFGSSAGNVELYDATQNTWWDNTGKTGSAMNPASAGADTVTASWDDTSIGLSAFNAYGQDTGWRSWLTPGDAITVYAENTQTGQTASYNSTYPKSAPMPTVSINNPGNLLSGEETLITGSVTWQGQALDNALVNLTASGGTLSATTLTTNSSGQFSVTYTAPSTTGTDTITASSITAQASTAVTVTNTVPITGTNAMFVSSTSLIQSVTYAGGSFAQDTPNTPVSLPANVGGENGYNPPNGSYTITGVSGTVSTNMSGTQNGAAPYVQFTNGSGQVLATDWIPVNFGDDPNVPFSFTAPSGTFGAAFGWGTTQATGDTVTSWFATWNNVTATLAFQ